MEDQLKIRRFLNRIKKELFPMIERKTYKDNIKSAVIKKDGRNVMFLVYDKDDQVPWWVLNRKGVVLPYGNILDLAELPNEEVKITDSFWTCGCDSYFIHHKVQTTCPICKLSVSEDTKILRIL